MDTRVKLLEYRADQTEKLLARIDGKLDGLSKDIGSVRIDLAKIDGSLTGIPKTWQVLTINVAVIGLVLAVLAGAWATLHAFGKI